MSKILFPRWLWLVAIWIPFPCLFLPFTMMREDDDPWYIEYTSSLGLCATVFYAPSDLLMQSARSAFGQGFSMLASNAAAFIQSLLLSLFVWKMGRRKPTETKPRIDAPPR